jgi:hypothetical protein
MATRPAKKARKVGDQQAVTALCSALSHGDAADEAFVMKCTQRADGATRALASLLRNGTVQKAIDRHHYTEMQALGKHLPPSCTTIASLPKNFKWKLFWDCVKMDSPISEEFVCSDRDIASKLNYALHCTLLTKLPTTHCNPDFEAPLGAVLQDIYKQNGNRLGTLTVDNFKECGYWSFDKAKNTMTHRPSNHTFGTRIENATLDEADDWKIDDPAVFDASLSSESSGAMYKILAMAKKAKVELEAPVDEFTNANPDSVPAPLKLLVVPATYMRRQRAEAKPASSSALSVVRAPRRPPPKARPTVTTPDQPADKSEGAAAI